MLLFYDIECFRFDSYVAFKDVDGNLIFESWNDGEKGHDTNALISTIKGNQLVGYNNYFYDDPMSMSMFRGSGQTTIKKRNDELIGGKGNTREYIESAKNNFLLKNSLDCFQQIDVSRPGLKKIEGNMGMSIEETQIDFNIDRPLTEEEKRLTELYCQHDIDATIEIYKLRKESYFDMKDMLMRMLKEADRDDGTYPTCKLSTNTISAKILLERPLKETEGLNAYLNDKVRAIWRKVKDVPDAVWDMWENIDYRARPTGVKNVDVKMYGCDIKFGFGGLHGVHSTDKEFYHVRLLDVASMYPNIIKYLGSLGAGSEVYANMIAERVAMKKTNPDGAAARKLILNSVYGNLKNQYSWLYQPMEALSVCIYGQLALFDLCRRLHGVGYSVMNINTDGVGFTDPDGVGDLYESIWHAWEEKWHLDLELDKFPWWIQKDVNNYIARKPNGGLKTKGGECNKAFTDQFFKNNDARIIQMALVSELTGGDPGWKVIRDNLDKPELYQYVLSAGSTYKGTVDGDDRVYQKVNRIFPVKEDYDSVKLYKLRPDGGKVNFPDMPDRMRVWNGDVKDIQDFEKWIDQDHYRKILEKKLKQWRT